MIELSAFNLSSIKHQLVIYSFAQLFVLLLLVLCVLLAFVIVGLVAVWHYSRSIRSFGSLALRRSTVDTLLYRTSLQLSRRRQRYIRIILPT